MASNWARSRTICDARRNILRNEKYRQVAGMTHIDGANCAEIVPRELNGWFLYGLLNGNQRCLLGTFNKNSGLVERDGRFGISAIRATLNCIPIDRLF